MSRHFPKRLDVIVLTSRTAPFPPAIEKTLDFFALFVKSLEISEEIKVSKQMILWAATLLFLQLVCAQDPAEYQKWLKKQQAEYQDFKDARDKEFVRFLNLEWKQMNAFDGLVPVEKPKPVKLPVYQPSSLPPIGAPRENTPIIKDIPIPKLKERLPEAPAKQEEPSGNAKSAVILDFFGTKARIGFNSEQKPMLGKDINKESISAFWAALSRTDYDGLVPELQAQRIRLGLNDWGHCQLVYQWCKQLFLGAQNEAVLMSWFLMSKSGFDARVAFSEGKTYLLLPTPNSLYYISYFTIGKNDKKYYAVPLEAGAKRIETVLYSYEGSYPGAEKSTDFSVTSAPVLGDRVGKKNLKFEYGGRPYSIQVEFNRDAVSFFEYYPQTNLEVYFTSSPSPEAMRSLLTGLKPIVLGKSELEAVNILLRFVQTAFEYRTDQEQFGREKPFFPEETIYYPYSDCEDRSILFTFLVKQLLGLDVVGLDYPSHIATAVMFSASSSGDAVVFQGKKYVICDPTYINADAGRCMPQFKTVKPNVIDFAHRK
jgi:hypothetical protein